MFGMSSEEFWEEDPQLYWAYRTFYLKKLENEQKQKQEEIKYSCWLNGKMNCIAHTIALNNAFSHDVKYYPDYNDMFSNDVEKENIDFDKLVQNENNAWARY